MIQSGQVSLYTLNMFSSFLTSSLLYSLYLQAHHEHQLKQLKLRMTSLLQPGLAWHILLASFYAFYAIFNSYLFLILSVLIWLADVIVRSIMAYTYLHVLILYFGSVI